MTCHEFFLKAFPFLPYTHDTIYRTHSLYRRHTFWVYIVAFLSTMANEQYEHQLYAPQLLASRWLLRALYKFPCYECQSLV